MRKCWKIQGYEKKKEKKKKRKRKRKEKPICLGIYFLLCFNASIITGRQW
jgi:hypothetical protein